VVWYLRVKADGERFKDRGVTSNFVFEKGAKYFLTVFTEDCKLYLFLFETSSPRAVLLVNMDAVWLSS